MVHVDLNLLTALDALLEENSVQAAADRLHLSPPAMSRTLARIRKATGDDILVRTGRTMTPTPRALALRDEVHGLVQRAQLALAPARTLDLPRLERTFSIQGHDALIGVLAPALLRASAGAPGIGLRFLSEAAVDTPELARGHVDLEVGATAPTSPEISSDAVGHDRMVVAFRAGHPLAAGPLTLQRFAAAEHVTVSRRGRLRSAVDDALATHGLHRRVSGALPTSTAALHLVAQTDAVVIVAERLCSPTWSALGIQTRALPLLELTPVPVILAWHSRYDTDLAHDWLRRCTRTALAAVLDPDVERASVGLPHM